MIKFPNQKNFDANTCPAEHKLSYDERHYIICNGVHQ